MTRLAVIPKGGEPKRGRAWTDQTGKRLCLLWLAVDSAVNPHGNGRTVPGCDNMVPLNLIPIYWLREKVQVDFQHIVRFGGEGIGGATIAEIEADAAAVYAVGGMEIVVIVKPYKQPIARAI